MVSLFLLLSCLIDMPVFKALDDGKKVLALFCDDSKAFD